MQISLYEPAQHSSVHAGIMDDEYKPDEVDDIENTRTMLGRKLYGDLKILLA